MAAYPGFKPWEADDYTKGELEALIAGLPAVLPLDQKRGRLNAARA